MPTLTVPAMVLPGGTITVVLTNGPGNLLDKVALYFPSTLQDFETPTDFVYLSGTKSPPGSGLTTATVTFTAPTTSGAVGNVRLLANGEYFQKLAISGNITVAPAAVVAGGGGHSLYRESNGTLWGTGLNGNGQLGGSNSTNPSIPVQVATGVASMAAGGSHTAYLKTNGTLWTTGLNSSGQLGDGTTTSRTTAVQVATSVAAVAAGGSSTFFIKTDGTLWAMGSNASGRLGDGTTTNRTTPVQVATGVASVAAGGSHTLFVKTDGTLWAMGLNSSGQLGDGTTTSPTLPVQVASGVASVAAGNQHTLFIKTDGTLWTMGSNAFGQLGDGTTTDHSLPVQLTSGVASVAASGSHTLFVKTDGTMWATGLNLSGQLCDGTTTNRSTPVQVATSVASVAAGNNYTLFVKTDGTRWAAGLAGNGALGDGSTIFRNVFAPVASGVASVATGSSYTLFVKSNGTLWATGSNGNGQFGDGTTVSRGTAVQVSTGVKSVAAGGGHTLFVKTDGTLWAAGFNSNGQLGDGTTTNRSTPVQVATGVASVAAGGNCTLFIKTDGTLWAMGLNNSGQLGDGTTTSQSTPVLVASGVASVATGGSHTLFVKTDGTLWAMGSNSSGQLGDGTTIDRITPGQVASGVAVVSAGFSHTLFVKTDGTLWATGSNSNGQLGDGTTTNRSTPALVASGVASVAAGSNNSFFVKTDGSLWAMGANGTGQLGDGTTTSRNTPIQVASGVTSVAAGGGYTLLVKASGMLLGAGSAISGQLGDGTVGSRSTPVPLGAQAPVIAVQPAGLAVSLGQSATLWVWATGVPAPTYQWKKGDSVLTGETNSVLTLANVQSVDAVSYTVIVSNSLLPSVTSSAAAVTLAAAPNTAPTLGAIAVSGTEDTPLTFTKGNFAAPFSDDQGDTLQSITIATVPTTGSLKLSNVTVTANQTISAANLDSGLLTYVPAANDNGARTFTVTASDGSLSSAAATVTMTLAAVNDAPVAAGSATLAAIAENATNPPGATVSSLFSANFSDTADQVTGGSTANTFAGIAISNYTVNPSKGNWQYTTNAGTSWTSLTNATTAAAITLNASDRLRFLPAADYDDAATTLSVNLIESGQTITSGAVVSLTGATGGTTHVSTATVALAHSISHVNHAPAGTDKTISATANADYIFVASDFGFTDPNDPVANSLQAVKITTLPALGSLKNNNSTVNAGQTVSVADINSGKLKFTPVANAGGTPYTTFTFQVQDDGGRSDDGVDLDPTPNTITFNVTGLPNTAPTLSAISITGTEDTTVTFVSGNITGAYNDAQNDPLTSINIVTLPTSGTLKLAGTNVTANQTITGANLGNLTYVPAANDNGAKTFTVTASDGNLSSTPPSTVTIALAPVNDAPSFTLPKRLFAWGDNPFGQYGNGSTQSSAVPVAVPLSGALVGKTVVSVAVGSFFSVALCSDGTLATWGANFGGQLGDGSDAFASTVPVAVPMTGALAGKTVVAVAAGLGHSVAACSDGTVVAWGINESGQLGNGSTVGSSVPVAVSMTGGLAGKTVVGVAAGRFISVAVCSDGTVAAWGANTYGELGNTSGGISSVPVAVPFTGALSGKRAIAASAGGDNAFVLCSDGTVAAWGVYAFVQLGLPTESPGPVAVSMTGAFEGKTVKAISAGMLHNLALCTDGTVVAWGFNGYGQLGSITESSLPVVVGMTGALAGKTVVAVSAHPGHSLALCSDGTLAAWGTNSYGGLGNGNPADSIVPVAVQLPTGTKISALSVGGLSQHVIALSQSSSVPADSGPQSVVGFATNLSAGPANESSQGLTLAIANTNSSLFSTPPAITQNGTLTYTPSGFLGTATLTVSLTDDATAGGDALTTSQTFDVTIAPVATTIVAADKLADRNVSAQTVTLTATVTPATSIGSVTFQIKDRVGANIGSAASGAVVSGAASIVYTLPAGLEIGTYSIFATYGGAGIYAGSSDETHTLTVYNAPVAQASSVTTPEDTPRTFSPTDVNFTNADGPLASITVSNLALAVGDTLTVYQIFGEINVTNGMTISVYDLPSLTYTPAANANGAGRSTFDFVVNSTGIGRTAARMTINVTPVNDAPVGTSKTVAMTANTDYVFAAADFGLTDPIDAPANTLQAVKITTLPLVGSLKNNNVAVTIGQFIALADLTAGKLKFTPVANATGTAYATFTFQVQDSGGTSNGGVDLDPSAKTITINVSAPLNTAPTLSAISITGTEDTTVTFGSGNITGAYNDAQNDPLASINIVTLPTSGTLKLAGTNVTANQTITAGNLGNLTYVPVANEHGATTFTVTASDGNLSSTPPSTVTITIAPVNDAPSFTLTKRLFAWGDNSLAEFGNGSTLSSAVPVSVPLTGALAGKTVVAVSTGIVHSMALCSDGTVATWGYNLAGQLGVGSGVAASGVPVAVSTTGVLSGKTVVAIAAGGIHNVVLCSDGTVATWGNNNNGQLGIGSTVSSPAPVAVSMTGGLAGKTVVGVAAGQDFSVAVCSDGTVAAWGVNSSGELGNASGTPSLFPVAVPLTGLLSGKSVVAVSAGRSHALALCSDRTVVAWGNNSYLQLGSSGVGPAPVAVPLTSISVLEGKVVKMVSAGETHSLALCTDGTVVSWGNNASGQLGRSTGGDLLARVDLTGALAGKTVVAVSGGKAHSLALCSDGTVAAWGANSSGGLGNSNPADSVVPVSVQLPTGTKISSLSAGGLSQHVIALSQSSSVPADAGPQTVVGFATNLSAGPANESSQSLTLAIANSNSSLFSTPPAITQNGTLTYTPSGFLGTATLTVSLTDDTTAGGAALTTSQTFDVTIAPVVTTIVAANKLADRSVSEQTVTLTATVTPATSIGSVTFQIKDRVGANIGSVASGAVVSGAASIAYTLPAGLEIGTYSIYATYGGAGIYAGSSDSTHTLIVYNAPVAQASSVTTNEDTAKTFAAADFNFTNADGPMASITVSNLARAVGDSLTVYQIFGEVNVTNGMTISVYDLPSLTYRPAANANGTGRSTFDFVVNSTAGSGKTAARMTINVTPVNDAPVGTSKTVAMTANTDYVFAAADFGLTDPIDAPANTLQAVKITTLPLVGSLKNNNVAVTIGQFIALADLTAGKLKFTPVANATGTAYATFTFQVQDSGGTANGGVDLDPAAKTITINVSAPLNTAPTLGAVAFAGTEDATLTLTKGPFATAYTDTQLDPLASITIATLPASGTLKLGNATVTANQTITAANLDAGLLTYVPAANENGDKTFTVTASDGSLSSAPASTVTMTLAAVNDAPVRTAGTVANLTVAEDSAATSLGLGGLNYSPGGGADEASQTLTYKVTALPSPTLGDIVLADGVTVVTLSSTPAPTSLVTSVGSGSAPLVNHYAGLGTGSPTSFNAFSPTFLGGARVAVGDINGDGVPDIVTGAGAGGAPQVNIFSLAGGSATQLASYFAFNPAFTGGIFVATGDVNRDGRADVIVGAGAGGGSQVSIFSGSDSALLNQFVVYDPAFTGGVRVGSGDVDGDGAADIIIGLGFGSSPIVRVFRGSDQTLFNSFVAYDLSFTGGIFVAGGDLNGDGRAEIVVGVAGQVRIFDGASFAQLAQFAPFGSGYTGEVTVGVVSDGGNVYVLAGTGGGTVGTVKVFNLAGTEITAFAPYGTSTAQVYVAGAVGNSSTTTYTLAQLQGMKFRPAANGSGGPATFSWTVQDSGGVANGGVDTLTESLTVTVTPVNDAPVVAANGGTLSYTENQAATAINTVLTVSDVDSASLTGATVSITGNFVAGQDVLGFTNQNNILGFYDASTGVLTLVGTSSVANYQTALRSVTYANSSASPSVSPRTVSYQVDDGQSVNHASNVVTSTVGIGAVNDAPVVDAKAAVLGYTENQAATVIATGLTVTDVDSANLTGATVSLAANFSSTQDVLGFTTQNGITGSYNAATSVLTLTGTATVANYQTALRSVTYANTSENPSSLPRTVSFQVDDGQLVNHVSNVSTATINVTPVNDAPVVAANGGTLSYTENQAATAINTLLTVSDVDSASLTGATVSITGNFVTGQDVLGFTNQNNILGFYDASTGVLTLVGTSSVANYQTALRSVTYANSSASPSVSPRTVSYQVDDGQTVNHASNVVTSTVGIGALNDAPVVDAKAAVLGYTENQAATAIATGLTVTDVDSANLTGATVSLTANFSGTQDVLGFATQNGITGSYNGTTGVLTLTGTATVANYQTALRSVTYANTSENPSSLPRTVSFQVDDGQLVNHVSNVSTATINVTPVNDVPVALASSVTTTEDTAKAFAVSDFLFTDVESNPLASITVSNLSLATGDTLKVNQGSTVVAVTNGMTLTAAQLPTLVYTPAVNANGAARSKFDFTVNDAGNGTVAASMTIDVTAVNDVPVALASSVTTSEDTAKTFAVANFLYSDVENDALVSITVSNLSLATGDTLKVNQGSTVVAVTNGMTLNAAQLPTLVYTPSANANGAARSKFDFTVNDAGNGTVAATLTIDVTAVNDVPVALASSVTTSEDTAKTFAVSDFLVSDAENNPLASITVSNLSLATGDTLKVNQGSTVVAVTNGMALTAAQLPTLVYTPAVNANGTARSKFDFTVNDAGNGIVAATMTINVTAVNDVPSFTVPSGGVWTARSNAGSRNWTSIASSSDGMKLAAVALGSQIFTSTDAGATWVPQAGGAPTTANWWSIASSADGFKLAAVVGGAFGTGNIYTSTDAGASWTERDSARAWFAIASSADGTKLAAVVNGGQIYTSADTGATWTARTAGLPATARWTAVSSSANGQNLAAVVRGGGIYTSTDAGANWVLRSTGLPASPDWATIASSADGASLVAAEGGFVTPGRPGKIYVSTDAGATWTARATDSDRQWYAVTSSADGTKLAAVVGGGQIYTSTDAGVTWTPRAGGAPAPGNWFAIASSADGSRLAATEFGTGPAPGQIYTSVPEVRVVDSPGAQTVAGFLTGISSGPADEAAQAVDFALISNDNTALFTVQPAIAANGTLTFTPKPGVGGVALVTVRAHDNGGIANGGVDTSAAQTFTVAVNNSPSDIALSSTTIAENNAPNATVGTLSTTDLDAGNTFTYSLVTGTGSADNSAFTITGSTLSLNAGANFEVKNSYSVRVRSTDQVGLFFEKAFTIAITDVNEAPTDIALSATSLAENNAPNATVGTLSTTDPDAGNTFTYTLVSGTGSTDNAAFSISGAALRLTPSANFEVKNSYSILVRSTDQGGLFVEKAFTINITEVNEAPTLAAIRVDGFEDTTLAFTAVNFTEAYADPERTPLASIKIETLPATGTLKLSGAAVAQGRVVAAADLGSLTYVPAPDENGAKTFTVSASDGVLSSAAATVTMTLAAVNDAPSFGLPAGGVGPAGATWTARPTAGSRAWIAVASSADGAKLVAAVNGGQIYTSTDGGTNWVARDSNRGWAALASSADGSKLVAGAYGGAIYTSSDSGLNWTARASQMRWRSLASSADGTKLAAGVENGQIFTSTDSGLNWTAQPAAGSRAWWAVASSVDGTRLVAVVNGGQIYTSTDGGISWVARMTDGDRAWSAVASSADGTKLAAVVGGGQIYTSTDGGANWVARLTDNNRGWLGIASSADGTKLAAAAAENQIYTSKDSGVSWTAQPASGIRNWYAIASSADGTQLVAADRTEQIYTSVGIAGAGPYSLTAVAGGGAFTQANFATGFSPGPADEATQTLVGYSVTVEAGKTGLFSAVLAIGLDGTLTFTPSATQSGTATITVVAQDSGSGTAPNVNVSASQTFTVTVTPPVPTITSVTGPTTGRYREGQTLSFTVNFDTAVTVTGTPQLPLTIGTASLFAAYASGSGSTALVFNYTVAPGDTDTDGIACAFPLVLNNGTIKNGATDATLAFTAQNLAGVLVDTTPPTITIAASKSSLAIGETATLTFTLSEASTNFTAADITVSGGTLGNFSGSGALYNATFTPTANSTTTAVITVAAGTFTDAAGNANTAATPLNLGVNTVAPMLVISTNDSALTIGETATLTFTLTAASTNFTAADITVSGGTLSNFSGSGTNYNATFTPTANSATTAVIAVAAGTFTDAAGNANTAATPLNLGVNTVAPMLVISTNDSTLTIGETATLTFTLSAASTNFTAADVTVSGGALSAFVGSGANYTATFTPTANRATTAVVTVAAGTFTDAVGNPNVAATPLNLTVDTIAPTIGISSSKSSLALGETATLTFTLSEASTNFTASDISVSGGTLSNFSGSGALYSATFTPTTNSTTAAVITVAAGTFTDAAGNANTAATPLNFGVNTVAPMLVISTNDSTLTIGETATLTFTLSAASTNFTAADITVSGGALSAFAGSSTVYTATFTPTANSATPGVIAVAAGTFTDAAGNANVAAAPLNLTVDTVAPTIGISSSKSSLALGETATLTFTLSEASTNFTAADVTVSGGTLSAFAGSGTGYSATFTPTADSVTTAGITVAAATFTDAAGNNNVAATPLNLGVNTIIPRLVITSNRSALTLGQTATLTFTFTVAPSSFTANDIQVSDGTNSGQPIANVGTVTNFTATSSTVYTALYTPAPNLVATVRVTATAGQLTSTFNLTVNSFVPTVTITTNRSTLAVGETATLTFTLSAASTDFTVGDIGVTGGTLSGFTAVSSTVYNATFTPAPLSTLTAVITVAAGSFADAGGNANTAATPLNLSVATDAAVVTWNAPAAISYGTLLGDTQLNAIANVDGTFVYTPLKGTKLNVGENQTLSVTFTPTDTVRYRAVTKTVALTVNKATPTVVWDSPATVQYLRPLTTTQLNATIDGVAGTFAYTPALGSRSTLGVGQTLNVSLTFTPTDTANYNPATVTKAFPVVAANYTLTGTTETEAETFPGRLSDYRIAYNSSTMAYTLTDVSHNPAWLIAKISHYEYFAFSDTTVTIVTPVAKKQGVPTPETAFDTVSKGVLNTPVGGIVFISTSQYNEPVAINQDVTLIGFGQVLIASATIGGNARLGSSTVNVQFQTVSINQIGGTRSRPTDAVLLSINALGYATASTINLSGDPNGATDQAKAGEFSTGIDLYRRAKLVGTLVGANRTIVGANPAPSGNIRYTSLIAGQPAPVNMTFRNGINLSSTKPPAPVPPTNSVYALPTY